MQEPEGLASVHCKNRFETAGDVGRSFQVACTGHCRTDRRLAVFSTALVAICGRSVRFDWIAELRQSVLDHPFLCWAVWDDRSRGDSFRADRGRADHRSNAVAVDLGIEISARTFALEKPGIRHFPGNR